MYNTLKKADRIVSLYYFYYVFAYFSDTFYSMLHIYSFTYRNPALQNLQSYGIWEYRRSSIAY